jgi:malate permease and related proteins
MMIMLNILLNNIFPIFVLIGLGFVLARTFSLDILTLTKINFYLLVPSFTFVYLYTTAIPLEMWKVLAAAIILMSVNYSASYLIAIWKGYKTGLKNAFVNSVVFYNSGNIGIPLITLMFSRAPFVINGETPYLNLALTTQIMILVIQNITVNSLGFFNAGRSKMQWRDSIAKIMKMPTIYAIPCAVLFKQLPCDLTQMPFWPALEYMKNALVAVALIILGVQISRTHFRSIRQEVILSVIIRLVGGPSVALAIVYLLSLKGIVAEAVLISSAVPTAVNTALIAVEYDNQPEFASQTVLISTLACTITLSAVIYLSRVLFPF